MRRQAKEGVMTDRLPLTDLSDSELEQRLIDLAPRFFPATPELTTPVRHRLESEAVQRSIAPTPSVTPNPLSRRSQERGLFASRSVLPSPDSEGPGSRRAGGVGNEGLQRAAGLERRNLWLVAALLLIAIAGGLVLFPQARNAIADRLGLHGVLIRWVDQAPTPEPSPVGTPLLLGRRVSLDDARAAVDFPVGVPASAGFNAPQEIYLLEQDHGAMVSFVYPAGPGLPASDETGVGALLTQFEGEADRDMIEKGLLNDGARETHLEAVTVGGEPGFWISGAPHTYFVVCYDGGKCRQERYRLAGNVLIWEQDGVTLRLESALPREDALAIAESLPAPE
jgi:hypothetical protein